MTLKTVDAILASLTCLVVGCCRGNSVVSIGDGVTDDGDAGMDAGDDTGPDAGHDAGRDAGHDGGSDAGRRSDAGTCRIPDAGTVAADTVRGGRTGWDTCTLCDPLQNPTGWTTRDAGEACEQFLASTISGALDTPTPGLCEPGFPAYGCTSRNPGSACDDMIPCVGGFCSDAGWCVIDQNLGVPTDCNAVRTHPNACADGPCCPDAGLEGVLDGGGWCCGLIDGGAQPACLPSGTVCYETSNCCSGLTCTGYDAVFGIDSGYGFCMP